MTSSGKMVSTLEQMQVPNGTGPDVRKSKRPLLASRTRCNVLWKPPKFGNNVKIGIKVQLGNKFANYLISFLCTFRFTSESDNKTKNLKQQWMSNYYYALDSKSQQHNLFVCLFVFWVFFFGKYIEWNSLVHVNHIACFHTTVFSYKSARVISRSWLHTSQDLSIYPMLKLLYWTSFSEICRFIHITPLTYSKFLISSI